MGYSLGTTLCGLFDLLGERQIGRRDSTRVVRRQRHRHFRVANVDVGVVIHLVGHVGDASHERDAVGELVERVGFGEHVTPARPARKSAQRALNFQV